METGTKTLSGRGHIHRTGLKARNVKARAEGPGMLRPISVSPVSAKQRRDTDLKSRKNQITSNQINRGGFPLPLHFPSFAFRISFQSIPTYPGVPCRSAFRVPHSAFKNITKRTHFAIANYPETTMLYARSVSNQRKKRTHFVGWVSCLSLYSSLTCIAEKVPSGNSRPRIHFLRSAFI